MADFRSAVERLSDAAPAEIRADYRTVSDSFGKMPDISDPVAALAGALFTGIVTGVAFDRIDEATEEHCGVLLFTATAPAVVQATTPILHEGWTVIDASNLFGKSHCQSKAPPVVAALSPKHIVVDCGQDIMNIDLENYKVAWRFPFPDEDARMSTAGNLAAVVTIDTTPAKGFEGETRQYTVAARSLDDGRELYKIALPAPDGVVVEGSQMDAEGVEIVDIADDGTVVLNATWPTREGYGTAEMLGLARDGSIRWRGEHWPNARPLGRNRLALQDSREGLYGVIDMRTNEQVLPQSILEATASGTNEGQTVIGSPCSDVVAVQDSWQQKLWVADLASGAVGSFDKVSTFNLYAVGGGLVNEHKAVDFHTPSGVLWSIPEDRHGAVEVVGGRLFIENQSGKLLEVNLADGTPKGPAPAEVPQTLGDQQLRVGNGYLTHAPMSAGAVTGTGFKFTEFDFAC